MNSSPSYWRIFLVLSGLAILSPLALDTFLPAVDDAAKSLNTNIGNIMISFGVLSVGIALGQIIHGPLSDRYGRKPIVVWGLIFYMMSSLLTPFVLSIELLYNLRFIQGLAVAATMIVMRSIVRDLFSVKEGAKLFANLFVILAIIPIIGPIIGGHLTIWFGWQSVFFLMAGISAIVLLTTVVLFEESLPKKDPDALKLNKLLSNFNEIITERNFLTFLLIGVGAYAGLYGVITGIAPVMTGLLRQQANVFGYQFAAIMIGHFISAAIAGKLVHILGIKKLLFIGTLISMIGGLLLIGASLLGIITIYSILIPSTIFLLGFALTIPGMTAGALSNFQHMAGRATSLLGFIQHGTGAFVSITLGYIADGSTSMPMAIAIAVASLFAFISFIIRIPRTILKA
ncbi:MAG TPA: Bcr/CflA family efflux MFS transporter [Rhodospirillales bacterium]|jgi:DHA1 family bicyclomycin/chloramphenicol resistance-like MFS transporter|nr:Bcr/CflA family efflux MFS transporter [Rhodospirillales bacterium]